MSIDPTLRDRIVAVAVQAARKAGDIQRQHAAQPVADALMDHDIKLQADRLCEEAIVETIHESFPDHSILAEEDGQTDNSGEFRWIIDPLDGTVNYYYGLPYYGASIACYATEGATIPCGRNNGLECLGKPVAGVIFLPSLDELFLGVSGAGTTCNGKPIAPRKDKQLAEAMIGMGFGKTADLGEQTIRQSGELARRVRKMRCLGAGAVGLAYVAAGRLSGFFEASLRAWDIAAGAIILAEAGAAMDIIEFEPNQWRVLASAPDLLGDLKAALI